MSGPGKDRRTTARESRTMQEVADHAGVSIATVSRVLTGQGNVSTQLRERVLASVEQLDYSLNSVARSLRTQANPLLGLIIPDITNPFFTSIARGVEDAAHLNGFSVVLANTDNDVAKERQYLEVATAARMSGVIMAPASTKDSQIESLLARSIPVVTVDQRLSGVHVDSVQVANKRAARMATEHLLAQGCRRVGMVAGPSDASTGADRLSGYTAALRAAAVEPDPALVERTDFHVEAGYRATQALLDRVTGLDGLVVANNLTTAGALDALAERQLTCPADIALVGFDDLAPVGNERSRVSIVRQPRSLLGKIAAELVLARIEGAQHPPRRVVLDAELVVRESSDLRGDVKSTMPPV